MSVGENRISSRTLSDLEEILDKSQSLKDALDEWGREIDDEVETPDLEYFELLVSEVRAARQVGFRQTAPFSILVATTLYILWRFMVHGNAVPAVAVVGAVWILSPVFLVVTAYQLYRRVSYEHVE